MEKILGFEKNSNQLQHQQTALKVEHYTFRFSSSREVSTDLLTQIMLKVLPIAFL